jgi:hypothetical protein
MANTTRSGSRGGATTTTDHEEIRRWVEARGGKPAVVEQTARTSRAGILRIDFPGYRGAQSLKPLEWEDWFSRFDEAGLAFLYQDETSTGKESRFNKLVRRNGQNRGTGKSKAAPSRARNTRKARSSATARGAGRKLTAKSPRGKSSKRGTKKAAAGSSRTRAASSSRRATPRNAAKTRGRRASALERKASGANRDGERSSRASRGDSGEQRGRGVQRRRARA